MDGSTYIELMIISYLMSVICLFDNNKQSPQNLHSILKTGVDSQRVTPLLEDEIVGLKVQRVGRKWSYICCDGLLSSQNPTEWVRTAGFGDHWVERELTPDEKLLVWDFPEEVIWSSMAD